MKKHFPAKISFTQPEGGMLLWAELPRRMAAMDLFELAIKDKLAFIPGDPFHVRGSRHNTLRLNFSCSDEDSINIGIERLGESIRSLIERNT